MMARWICRTELAQRSMVWLPLPGGRLPRTWCIAHAAGRKVSIAEETFIGLCKDAAAGLAEG
jgi:DNA-binding transcriptional LysR family regulator